MQSSGTWAEGSDLWLLLLVNAHTVCHCIRRVHCQPLWLGQHCQGGCWSACTLCPCGVLRCDPRCEHGGHGQHALHWLCVSLLNKASDSQRGRKNEVILCEAVACCFLGCGLGGFSYWPARQLLQGGPFLSLVLEVLEQLALVGGHLRSGTVGCCWSWTVISGCVHAA